MSFFKVDKSMAAAATFDVFPEGNYPVACVKSEMKTSQAGNDYLALHCRAFNKAGDWQNVFVNLNLGHPKPMVQEIATKTLNGICMSAEVSELAHPGDLVGSTFFAALKVRKSAEYGDKNELKTALPLPKGLDHPMVAAMNTKAEEKIAGYSSEPVQPIQSVLNTQPQVSATADDLADIPW